MMISLRGSILFGRFEIYKNKYVFVFQSGQNTHSLLTTKPLGFFCLLTWSFLLNFQSSEFLLLSFTFNNKFNDFQTNVGYSRDYSDLMCHLCQITVNNALHNFTNLCWSHRNRLMKFRHTPLWLTSSILRRCRYIAAQTLTMIYTAVG